MKTLIVYRTHHGTTEYLAEVLKQKLDGEVDTVNLKKNSSPQLEEYSSVIIGGSIHAGSVQKSIKKFCSQNSEILKSKKLGLYLCCMEEGETATKQFIEAFPEDLREKSVANGLLGGQLLIEKMNFFEKGIIKKIANIENSVSKIDEPAMEKFVLKFNSEK